MNRSQSDSHLKDDDLIGLLYGLGDAEGHLARCEGCAERLSTMRKARAQTIGTTEVSGRLLAVQRQEILERLERPAPGWRVWAPATGAVALFTLILFLYRPAGVPQPPAAINAEADAELFTDVYSMEQDVEPRAAAPIHAMFISEESLKQ